MWRCIRFNGIGSINRFITSHWLAFCNDSIIVKKIRMAVRSMCGVCHLFDLETFMGPCSGANHLS